MAEAEGFKLPYDPPNKILTRILETFPYQGEKQIITYSTKEFSPVCPYSGLPDFATLIIEYIPEIKCIELKSLKYYLTSFRSVGIFQEEATNRIFEDLYDIVDPNYLKITTIYNTRGGIDSECTIEKGQK